MANICRIKKGGKVGETSSKYGYPGGDKLFEADIERHARESEALCAEFAEWMIERQVTPDIVRKLFVWFFHEFCEAKKEDQKDETV